MWRLYLVTDEVPLLLIIILPEETCFIWGQVHRVLKNKRALSHQNTQDAMYPWRRLCAHFLWVTAVWHKKPCSLWPHILCWLLISCLKSYLSSDIKKIFLLNSPFQTKFLHFLKETAFVKLTATIVGDCQCVAMRLLRYSEWFAVCMCLLGCC